MPAGDPVVMSLWQQQDDKGEVRHGQASRPSYLLCCLMCHVAM